MSLTLTNPTLGPSGQIVDATDINENFADIATKFGNIDNSDVKSAAGIDVAKLSAQNYEFVVNLEIKPTTAVAPGTSATIPIAMVGLPAILTTDTFTIVDMSYAITDSGDAAATTTFNVSWGSFIAGVWTATSSILNATNITGGTAMQSAAITPTASSITGSTGTERFIALFLTAIGANALNTAYSSLVVSIRLKRNIVA
jgi:hypothetical protein